ncbi:MAG: substrate-binding domain-containing protein [Clostridia bacterium]|nr:substrate-binding domain-containing protein [Clostridia bacterium]
MNMNLYLIYEPVDADAFWITDIVDGIVRESMKKALNLIVINDGNLYSEHSGSQSDTERPLVLVVGCSLIWIDRTLRELSAAGAEPILVSVYEHRFSSVCSSVAFNTIDAMRSLVCAIASSGRRSIAFFALHRDTIGDFAKLKGYAAGMHACQLPFQAADIFERGSIADCAGQLCQQISHYDAVVCSNDLLATYLTRHLQSCGIRVPEDICVTGFGNWSVVDSFTPKLTRMYTDLTELGCQAVRLHQYLQFNPQIGHCSSVLECTLQTGETAPLRSSVTACPDFALSSGIQAPAYSTDPDIMELLRAEHLVRSLDEIDRKILSSLIAGQTYSATADAIPISESTVKYRIGKILKFCGFADRQELLDFITKYHLFTRS